MEKIDGENITRTGLSKQDLAEITYTQIMALGYNNQNINSTLADLMPTRNSNIYPGPEETDSVNMALHLVTICKDFAQQLRAFQCFNQMTQEQKPHDEIIRNVKMLMLSFT